MCSKEIIALTQALIEQKRNGPDAIHHLHLLVLSNLPTHKGANISHSPSFVAIVEKQYLFQKNWGAYCQRNWQ